MVSDPNASREDSYDDVDDTLSFSSSPETQNASVEEQVDSAVPVSYTHLTLPTTPYV